MKKRPKVLLLGDSIRMSYQPHVAERLAGRAEIVGPADNCQYALFTLSSLDRWVQSLGQPDVIHWNNGLHDAGHNPNRSPVQIPLDMYRDNLRFILLQLRRWTPNVIWATMTPVHARRPFRDDQWSWRKEEVDAYNRTARDFMESCEVPVNDLHGLVQGQMESFLVEDGVHLNEAGQNACADAVVKAVSPFLPKR